MSVKKNPTLKRKEAPSLEQPVKTKKLKLQGLPVSVDKKSASNKVTIDEHASVGKQQGGKLLAKKNRKKVKNKKLNTENVVKIKEKNSDSSSKTKEAVTKQMNSPVKQKKKKKYGEQTNVGNDLITGRSDSKDSATKTEKVTKSEKRTPLTARQKHKLLKLRQKRKAKREGKVLKKSKESTSPVKETGKVSLPKKAAEASSNWKTLQATLQKEGQKFKKRPPKSIRNPKLMKVEEWRKSSNVQEDNVKTETPEIWFDDVDEILLDRKPLKDEGKLNSDVKEQRNSLVKPDAFKGLTKVVGIDCEMVGVGDGTDNMLARVSIVNQYGEPVYDEFVKPMEEVVDYRTHVSGVRPQDLETGKDFKDVQKDVADIVKGRLLVGHALKNDLQVLYLSHPKKMIRDTSRYKPFRQLFQGRNPSLKKLSEKLLSVKIQEAEHNSVQDAQATMRLYTMYRERWEKEIKAKKTGKIKEAKKAKG